MKTAPRIVNVQLAVTNLFALKGTPIPAPQNFDQLRGSILLVSMDSQPIANSSKLLLQVMSEEKPYGWTTDLPFGRRTIAARSARRFWRAKRGVRDGQPSQSPSGPVRPGEGNGKAKLSPLNAVSFLEFV